eukprot:97640-Prymnesium_polylepis.1
MGITACPLRLFRPFWPFHAVSGPLCLLVALLCSPSPSCVLALTRFVYTLSRPPKPLAPVGVAMDTGYAC